MGVLNAGLMFVFTPSIYKKKQKPKYLCYVAVYGFTYQRLESFWYLIHECFHSYMFVLSYTHIISWLQHMESTKTISHYSLSANWCVPTTVYKIMKHFTYYWQGIWAVKYGTSHSYSQTPGKVQMNSTGLVKAHFLSLIPCLPKAISVV